MPDKQSKFYITTPIYYVNDRPHLGHVYTTTIADITARYHRLRGEDVFFLTGTDEHAQKVVDSAAQRNLTPLQWADKNAQEFQKAFANLNITNDDFIRTTEPRHKEKVAKYVRQLLDSGDVYEGEYEGWYDAGQEEYITENKARELDYQSEINGKPLVRRKEANYFFRLSAYSEKLLALLESDSGFDVQPEARKNEVIARIKEGLNDVPISRNTAGADTNQKWGISIPGDEQHVIYVWIDALLNYLTAVDTDSRMKYWPADIHLVAKDILWFHAVIWPALLMALDKPLPGMVYAHSFWISEGKKMSKSLGNFVDLEKIDDYVNRFSLDALRYFLATQGPLGTTDSDLSEAKFIEVYNADLANTLGNSVSRVTNMICKYFDGKVPENRASKNHDNPQPLDAAYHQLKNSVEQITSSCQDQIPVAALGENALNIVRAVDRYIEVTQPFKLAKVPDKLADVGDILYASLEALRIASIFMWPIMPEKIEVLWSQIGQENYSAQLADKGRGNQIQWLKWGQLKPDTSIDKGEPLFPRYQ